MRERGGRRRLRRLGDGEQGRAGPGGRLDGRLPPDRLGQHADLEADFPPGPRARRRPARRERGRRRAHARRAERAVAVVGVVADLGRGENERHRCGEPCAVADGHLGAAHAAQRAASRRAPLRRAVRLRLGQHRDDQSVVVGREPRRLAMIVAQRQAHTAQVRPPRVPELTAEAVPAWPNDPEHCPRPPTARPAPRCPTAPGAGCRHDPRRTLQNYQDPNPPRTAPPWRDEECAIGTTRENTDAASSRWDRPPARGTAARRSARRTPASGTGGRT